MIFDSRCTSENATQDNYGGKNSRDPHSKKTAYMHVQKTKLDDVLCSITRKDVSEELHAQFESFKKDAETWRADFRR